MGNVGLVLPELPDLRGGLVCRYFDGKDCGDHDDRRLLPRVGKLD